MASKLDAVIGWGLVVMAFITLWAQERKYRDRR